MDCASFHNRRGVLQSLLLLDLSNLRFSTSKEPFVQFQGFFRSALARLIYLYLYRHFSACLSVDVLFRPLRPNLVMAIVPFTVQST
jgi:hypothetical protein